MSVSSHRPIGGQSQLRSSRVKINGKKFAENYRASRRFRLEGLARLEPTLQSLAVELGRVRERERKTIADQLHDQIGQNLVLAKMKLSALKSLVTEEQVGLIAGISDLMDQTIKDTRSLIHELHVEWLADLDLKEAIDCLLERLQSKYRLCCVTDIGPLPKSLNKEIQEVLLQAIGELIVNVAKHAGVNAAKITCESERGWIRIRVVDEGRGFDLLPASRRDAQSGGFGLMILRARLEQVGGKLYIDSHAGLGTRATIVLQYT